MSLIDEDKFSDNLPTKSFSIFNNHLLTPNPIQKTQNPNDPKISTNPLINFLKNLFFIKTNRNINKEIEAKKIFFNIFFWCIFNLSINTLQYISWFNWLMINNLLIKYSIIGAQFLFGYNILIGIILVAGTIDKNEIKINDKNSDNNKNNKNNNLTNKINSLKNKNSIPGSINIIDNINNNTNVNINTTTTTDNNNNAFLQKNNNKLSNISNSGFTASSKYYYQSGAYSQAKNNFF